MFFVRFAKSIKWQQVFNPLHGQYKEGVLQCVTSVPCGCVESNAWFYLFDSQAAVTTAASAPHSCRCLNLTQTRAVRVVRCLTDYTIHVRIFFFCTVVANRNITTSYRFCACLVSEQCEDIDEWWIEVPFLFIFFCCCCCSETPLVYLDFKSAFSLAGTLCLMDLHMGTL